jgi:hypothetical protein
MDPSRTVRALAAFEGRGPGTDAERRAALWLRDQVRSRGRDARVDTVWVRPQWAAVYAGHAALAAAASALCVSAPTAGLALGLAVALSFVGDLTGAFFLLRRASPERATQNVVSSPAEAAKPVKLVVCASVDAPRSAALTRRPPVRVLALAVCLVCACAGARLAGLDGRALGIVQLIPTVTVLVAAALLVDIALSDATAATNASSAAAVALALVAELDAYPPRNLDVELVIAGAGQGPALGMRAYVRARRKRARREELAILAIEPSGASPTAWWTHDGLLLPLQLHPQLVSLAAAVARAEPGLRAVPLKRESCTAAFPARQARWPAIAVGARRWEDDASPAALDATLHFCLALVGRLDAWLDRESGA